MIVGSCPNLGLYILTVAHADGGTCRHSTSEDITVNLQP